MTGKNHRLHFFVGKPASIQRAEKFFGELFLKLARNSSLSVSEYKLLTGLQTPRTESPRTSIGTGKRIPGPDVPPITSTGRNHQVRSLIPRYFWQRGVEKLLATFDGSIAWNLSFSISY
jgi:hypothetical protein